MVSRPRRWNQRAIACAVGLLVSCSVLLVVLDVRFVDILQVSFKCPSPPLNHTHPVLPSTPSFLTVNSTIAGDVVLAAIVAPPSTTTTTASTPPPLATPRVAYMLYATDARTVCNAVIMVHNIRHLGTPLSIPIVTLVSSSLPPQYTLYLQEAGAVVVPVEPWQQPLVHISDEYAMSLTKLRIFEQRGYDKVVYLDSDAVIQRNLDHLFHLGDAILWAPHAYYIGEQYAFGTTLLVVTPSDAAFAKLQHALETPPRPNYYDMDVLNDLWRLSCGYLPSHYVVLTPSLNEDLVWAFKDKQERINKTYVHHYSRGSDLAKPWHVSKSMLETRNPAFHPLFYDLFYLYWVHEDKYCKWIQS
ncbi:hypothetical protein B5M09_010792 [Aphanomyces astaci]|uniref:Nucleotide-diphospho-sugar transferase domain-containing protein n=1 Tax=Aphanomyces astaci TaxID=112090 RepID=A0A425CVL5_APHAT|nr:hypothetical protein B5M09_010792 [Aphanomyces astaci]